MKRYCKDCAPDGADHYTVNEVDGQQCEACGTTIAFGERCFYTSA